MVYCPRCGAINPGRARFCCYCSAPIASVPETYPQPQYPPVKKSKTPIIPVAVMAIWVVVILVLLLVIPSSISSYALHKGDYLTYSYSGYGIFRDYSGTMKIEITNVTSTTYTVTLSYTGDFTRPTTSETYPIENVTGMGDTWNLGEYLGAQSVSTAYGMKNLDHYYLVDSSGVWDYWVGHNNKIPYTVDFGIYGSELEFNLSDTNIDWIKNG